MPAPGTPRRRRLVALAAATALLWPALALAFAPPEEKGKKAEKAEARALAKLKKAEAKAGPRSEDGGKLARETFSALRELNDAVKGEAKAAEAKAATAKAPAFPKRTVETPTLTPAALDALVDKFLEGSKAPAAALTTDVEFVRRVYLDVTGKLPTPEQTRAFVVTRERDRRGKLIEHLLNSPEYAANWARYWRDVIQYHATNPNFGRVGYGELEDWLEEQFAKNRPWDETARDLITATGRNDENGATVFHLAHAANADVPPAEVAGEVSRIFLGVQIQCANCHDHPNDQWKRQQFHEFASFFAGTRARLVERPSPGQPAVFQVVSPGRPKYTMPDLKDPQKPIFVAPKFFLGAAETPTIPAGLTAEERRGIAAKYVTAQDNPWFAKAYVNRVWYALMGDAFYTPVDDLGPGRKAKAPEVLDALATQFARGGYDVRWLFRTILNTKAYQREVRSTYSSAGRTPFAANCASRLRADQILESLAQALNLPLDGRGPAGGPPGVALKKAALTKDLKEAAGKVKGARAGNNPRVVFNFLFGVDPSVPNDDVLGTIPQALFLMNAPQISRAIEARPNTVLGQILASTPDNRAALDALYLRVLARQPTPKEVQTCARYLETVGNRREAFEDILWGLINSTEFITRR